ncbi:unnamed protein product [Gadus morhua 'NCC']
MTDGAQDAGGEWTRGGGAVSQSLWRPGADGSGAGGVSDARADARRRSRERDAQRPEAPHPHAAAAAAAAAASGGPPLRGEAWRAEHGARSPAGIAVARTESLLPTHAAPPHTLTLPPRSAASFCEGSASHSVSPTLCLSLPLSPALSLQSAAVGAQRGALLRGAAGSQSSVAMVRQPDVQRGEPHACGRAAGAGLQRRGSTNLNARTD